MLTIRKGQKIWACADSHHGHFNIMKYCNRPFKTTNEMDEKLIENWNSVVGKNDIIFHLGDFAFRNASNVSNYVNKLNGKITLLMGNHDKFSAVRNAGFERVIDGHLDLKIFDENTDREWGVFLFHYPLISWSSSYHGRSSFHGHVHSGPFNHPFNQKAFNSYDVGVDNNNFTPINMIEQLAKMEKEFKERADSLKAKNEIF